MHRRVWMSEIAGHAVAPQQSAGDLGGVALAQRMVAGTGEELRRTLAKLGGHWQN